MRGPMLTVGDVAALRRRVYAGLTDETRGRAESSAVVFAPHQDDETLGCGGTIALKSAAGSPLSCVFMTDGHTSHQAFMDPARLARLRRDEALEAVAVLGMNERSVAFLDFPDGELAASHGLAVERVASILRECAPAEVYVPYRRDGTPDHEATYRIVHDALMLVRRPTRVLEYPVWFWNRWPWVPLEVAARRSTLHAVRQAVDAKLGLELMREFKTGVHIREVIDRKRDALAKHRSQMSALMPEKPWPTLHNVSDGAFLRCFFQDFEVFRSSVVPLPDAV